MSANRGWKTTEFWATVVTAALVAANKALGWGLDEGTMTQVVGAVAAYVLSRGVAKKPGAGA